MSDISVGESLGGYSTLIKQTSQLYKDINLEAPAAVYVTAAEAK